MLSSMLTAVSTHMTGQASNLATLMGYGITLLAVVLGFLAAPGLIRRVFRKVAH